MVEAPVCLLIPGTLCDERLYSPLQAGWAERGLAPKVRVANLHTLPMGIDAWWRAQLSDLAGPLDVLGFSLGGVLALDLLARAPERVRRLMLVASNPMPGSALHRERVQAQRTQWTNDGPVAVADAMLNEASPRAVSSVRTRVREMAAATPSTAFVAQGDLNANRPDGTYALSQWRGPLQLVSGQLDPWCGDDKQALMLHAHPQAHWLSMPETGHYLPLEQPQALAQISAKFFWTTDPS